MIQHATVMSESGRPSSVCPAKNTVMTFAPEKMTVAVGQPTRMTRETIAMMTREGVSKRYSRNSGIV